MSVTSRNPRATITLAAAALAVLTTPAFAQLAPPAPRPGPMGGPEERRELNIEQAQFAHDQLAANAEAQQLFERRTAEFKQREVQVEQTVQKIADDDAAAKAKYEAEKDRLAKQYEADMARWRSDVAACKAGQTSRCAKSS